MEMARKIETRIEDGILLKECRGCGEYKILDDFYNHKDKFLGKEGKCKKCTTKHTRKYYADNKKLVLKKQKNYYTKNIKTIKLRAAEYRKTHKRETKECNRQYRIRNAHVLREKGKEYRAAHKEYIKCWQRGYRMRNKKTIRNRQRKWETFMRKQNPLFVIKARLRTRLYSALKTKQRVSSATADLGCSINEFESYLETLFYPNANGIQMSWDNYGYNGWHIDHHIPLSYFDLTDVFQSRIACHYLNLRPLWQEDNFEKRDKVPNDANELIAKIKKAIKE